MKRKRSMELPAPPDFATWTSSSKIVGNLDPDEFVFKGPLGEVLGEGSHGLVIKAFWKTNQLDCAIKRIPRPREGDRAKQLGLIVKEIKLLYILKHPRILQIYGFYTCLNYFYIVTEFLPGGDLGDRIKKTPLTEKQASKYTKQVAEALEYLHSKQIIHRDIKLQNILITTDDSIKLCDFGLAIKAPSGSITGICGPPVARAPEMIKGLPYSNAVDWWGLGIMLYTMVTGKGFFVPRIGQALNMPNINKVRFPETVSKYFCEAVRSLLTEDPKKRLKQLKDLLWERFLDEELYDGVKF